MPDSMRGLRTFCVVARRLSFKDAARELCVTPSAVSHQIRVLENSLGVTLFRRMTREIALSDAGAVLYAQLTPLLSEIDQITARIRASSGKLRLLRVSLPPFFASELLVPRLKDFTRSNPAVQIRLETVDCGTPHPATSDASILLSSSAPENLCCEPLFPLSLVPACSPETSARLRFGEPASLLAETLIVHKSRPNAWHEWFEQCGHRLESEPKVLFLDSMFSVARAAERSLGVALVPLPLSASWLESGTLVRAHSAELETNDNYYFVCREEDQRNHDVRAFRSWALTAFAKRQHESAVA